MLAAEHEVGLRGRWEPASVIGVSHQRHLLTSATNVTPPMSLTNVSYQRHSPVEFAAFRLSGFAIRCDQREPGLHPLAR